MTKRSPRHSRLAIRLFIWVLCCMFLMPVAALLPRRMVKASTHFFQNAPEKNLPNLDLAQGIQNPSPAAADPIPSTLENCSPYDPYCGASLQMNGVTNQPPTVSLTSPANGASLPASTPFTIAAAAADSDGYVKWVDFYTGTTYLGRVSKVNPATGKYEKSISLSAGSYTLKATATDNLNAATNSPWISITVTGSGGGNNPPTANPGGPYSGTVNTSISFSGSGSDPDPGDFIVSYDWNFGDGSAHASGSSVQHTYTAQGTYTVMLTVTDSHGATGSMNTTAMVNPAGVRTPFNGPHNMPGRVEAEDFDNGGQNYTYFDTTVGNAWGVYRLTDVDIEGPIAGANYHVGNAVAGEWLEYSINVPAGTYDLRANLAAPVGGGTFHISIDGVNVSGPMTLLNGTGGWGSYANVTKNNVSITGPPQHIMRVTLDANGSGIGAVGNLNWFEITSSSGNHPPTANPGGPYSGAPNSAISFNGSGSDPDPGDFIVSYDWNFNDGSAHGSGSSVQHTYTAQGTYTVTLTVADNHGATGTGSTTANVTAPPPPPSGDNYSIARLDPNNRTGEAGEDLLSRNFNWSLPLLALKGRAGLDLGLALTYNSLVWTRSGNTMKFNADNGFPGPGFRLGFPVIQQQYVNTQVGSGVNAYLLITPSGRRVELRQIMPGSSLYDSADSSYLRYDSTARVLWSPDGSQMTYRQYGNEYRCTQVKDRNGNYLQASYNDGDGRLASITDTLGRIVTFSYDNNRNLLAISQVWNGQTHNWATFGYGVQTIQTNFPGLQIEGPPNGAQINVLTRVNLDDGTYFIFDYTSWGQVYQIKNYAYEDHLLNRVTYNLPLTAGFGLADCPRFTERRDWAENWNFFINGNNDFITSFSPDTGFAWRQVTTPDNTTYKENFYTFGWQRGLVSDSQVIAEGATKKTTTIGWTQDDTNLAYRKNPRPQETNVYDGTAQSYTNRRRTTITYTTFGLPSDVYEYDTAVSPTTVLRRTHTDYDLGGTYINANTRIIGLPTFRILYDGVGTMSAKVGYEYDTAGLVWNQGEPTNHDAGFGTNFVLGRGNLCKVRRYDVGNGTSVESSTTYNTAGGVISTKDPLNHQVMIAYTDSFTDGVNHNTLAYPTTVTDPDNYSSTVQYGYDQGVVRRTQDPKGAVVVTSYDSAGRVEQVTNNYTGAYTRWVYADNHTLINRFATVENGQGEQGSFSVMDGLGRVRGTASWFQDSVGGYRGQSIGYDSMGRVMRQSNPTEMDGNWGAAGDDAGTGWVFTEQTYDWNGRPRITTNPDQTTRQISYSSCGCAGGDVMTVTDEVSRQQKVYHDVLGRVRKTEVLNANLSVYSTTINTYNVRDQVTQICQQAGAVSGTTCGAGAQIIQMGYDGHGRLQSRKAPIESNPTTYEYYDDDTVKKRTDPRSASASFTYNARHLVTAITYAKPGNAPESPIVDPNAIPNAGNVGFGYDAVGNRTSMTDAAGSVSYVYNTISQLISESRTFSGVGTFGLSYTYNLGGELKTITDPFNGVITYAYNKAGEVTGVTGSGYQSVTQFASTLRYRAWGDVKHWNDGNGSATDFDYNTRLQVTSYNITNSAGNTFGRIYEYYTDARVKKVSLINIDPTFNRRYVYDQAGRLSQGLTGRAAQEPPLPPDPDNPDPYNQTYQYDIFNNMVGRTNTFWNHQENPFAGSFVNDRNASWTYDAGGNVKEDDQGGRFTYNSAGKMSDWYDFAVPANAISQIYDGDGQPARKVESHYNNASGTVSGSTRYFVRSTVLGGQVVAELNENGQKRSRYVYANGGVLAREVYVAFPPSYGVVWRYEDPITQDRSEAGNAPGTGMDLDPLGGLIPAQDPFNGNPNPNYGDLLGDRPAHQDDADPFEPGTGCTQDGVPVNCSEAMSKLNHGALVVAPRQTVVGTSAGRLAVWQPGGGYYVYDPSDPRDKGASYDGETVRLGVSDVVAWRWVGDDPEATIGDLTVNVGFQQKLTEMFYWGPTDEMVGHLSLRLSDGTDISYWPAPPCANELRGRKWTNFQPFLTCPPIKNRTHKDDCAKGIGEGRPPDETVRISGLNEEAIKTWWNNGEGHGNWGSVANNCSNTVLNALRVGGFDIPGGRVGVFPIDVLQGVKKWGTPDGNGSFRPRPPLPPAGYIPYWHH